jgi:type II secretory pathway pseudopilin PulG
MSRLALARFSTGAVIVMMLAAGLARPAWSQEPSADERLRALEEQNRRILERLQQAETRNASLEGELRTLKDENDPHNNAVETQVNKLSGSLADGITWKQLTRSGFPIKFYGFFREDAYYTTARMDSVIIPFFVRNESNGEAENNDDAFAFDARLTRFGFDVDGGMICKTAITGKLEIDFANFIAGTVESRETPRMRLAYVNLKTDKWYLRIGQDWDVLSPLFPAINAESLMWNAGNVGDRRPQVQYGWASGTDTKCGPIFDIKVAAGLTGAISNQDLDPTVAGVSNERDGFDSGLPHVQARIGTTFGSWVCDQNVILGAWGAVGWNETDTQFNGEDEFTTWLVGIDFQVPLLKSLKLRGELWAGQALSDFRGGITQSINTVSGEEIESVGGWAEVVFDVTKTLTLAAGATADNPDDGDLVANNKDLNYSMYLASKYDFGGGFKLGFDVIFWETQYLDTGLGNTMRFDLYTQFDF